MIWKFIRETTLYTRKRIRSTVMPTDLERREGLVSTVVNGHSSCLFDVPNWTPGQETHAWFKDAEDTVVSQGRVLTASPRHSNCAWLELLALLPLGTRTAGIQVPLMFSFWFISFVSDQPPPNYPAHY